MAVKLNLGLKQQQNLMMTPQLQQAIKLLTLTHLELSSLIAQEVVENPILEEIEGDYKASDDKSGDQLDNLERANQEATSDNFTEPEIIQGGASEIDWNSYCDSFSNNSSTPSGPSMVSTDSEDEFNYENMVSKGSTLVEHLMWQLGMMNLTDDELKFAQYVIHNIDDEGYLETPFDEIINETKFDAEDAGEILKIIHNLDPVGCGARSFKECLMIQARAMDERSPLVEIIIDKYLEKLQSKDYNFIMKEVGVDKEKIKLAELIIQGFNPKPGRLISPEEAQYIVPDIYVKEVGGKLVIQLNDEGVPRLKISKLYQSLLKSGNNAETKEYVQEKLRSAMWLLKSIQNRQRTIVKVAEAILKYQPDFFRKGVEHLKPMILKDIAQEIGMHESTVSRVTTNKFMRTPIGIFELKFFFNTGIGGKNGGTDIAGEALKLKIKALIEAESSRRPLSDQKIVELLKREDIEVARRTVAKYRETMNILPSAKRKNAG
ncbi:MAG: RNA polymerase factor sigma-54 [Bacteriovoracaceae bacterium]